MRPLTGRWIRSWAGTTIAALLCLFAADCGGSTQAARSAVKPTSQTKSTSGETSTSGTIVVTTTLPTTTPPVSCAAFSGYQILPAGRTMLLRAPASNHRRAAIIMLHGYTATPEGEETVSGWTALMEGTDVVVAYPEGSPTPYGGYGWAIGTARDATSGTDDVAEIDNVINQLIGQDCVDPAQIMVAGESTGSGLGLLVACDPRTAGRVNFFALAIPAVDPNVTSRCAGARPFPLLVIASLLDQTVPYDGIPPAGLSAFTAPLAFFGQIATSVDGCSGTRTTLVPGGTHVSYTQCTDVANFFVANDGHHTWPGGPTGAGGLSPGGFPASKVAWCESGLTATPPPVDCSAILAAYELTGDR